MHCIYKRVYDTLASNKVLQNCAKKGDDGDAGVMCNKIKDIAEREFLVYCITGCSEVLLSRMF